MLSAVERCVEQIAETRNERIDLSRIPYDDPATYDCIQSAETTGVFQIESRAQMQSLRRTRPETLKDLTIQVAIVRPGPIQGGAVNPYIERRQRLRVDPDFQIPYEHPSLESVLHETLGTIIFQDQVLEVAIAFAGFSTGEAEGLRRAMSRKRSQAAIEAHHRRFVAGAKRLHDVDDETAERVFSMIQGFSGFGFPKAHGAAFGLLAYQSTWLRVHYGPEFLCSLLNEQPMGFYPPDALVHEAQRRGIAVLAPDVNESDVECRMTAGEVRIGLGYVRGVRGEERARSWRLERRRPLPKPRRPGVASRGRCPVARAARVVRGMRLARRRPTPRCETDRALAARCERSRATRSRRRPAVTGIGPPRRSVPPGAVGLGVNARRLLQHRADGRHASPGAAARPPPERQHLQPRARGVPGTDATSVWVDSSSPGSDPARPAASYSCCSRTSSEPST